VTRIVVLIKDIPDLTEVKIDPTTRRPQTDNVKRKLNDLDKRALEAAIRLKEATSAEVVTLSLGDERTKTSLLEALAMGADASYLVNDSTIKGFDGNGTSKVLASALARIGDYDLILAGELSLDGMGSQIGPRVSRLLDIPQVTYAKEIKLEGNRVRALRDLEESDEVVEADTPVLVTVVREINEPRIPTLMNIMKAKKKPITEWNLNDLSLGIDELKASVKVRVTDIKAPEVKRKKIAVKADKMEDVVSKLLEYLVSEGVLEA